MHTINAGSPTGGSLLKELAIIAGIFGSPIAIVVAFFVLRHLFLYIRAWVRAARVKIPATSSYPPGGVAYDAESTYTACPICLEDFTAGEEVAVLQCTHLFHPGCLKKQVEHFYVRCPVCNAKI